jgi:small subunit ribosomal protein S29
MSLAQLAEIGANDPDVAWNLFMLLWQELTTSTSQPRPPILLAIDSVSHLMTETQYRSSDFKPIHAHDLALVNHLMSHFSGAKSLGPSGGILLASTSESNCPHVYSFELALKQILARQDQQSAIKSLSSPDSGENTIPAPDTWTLLDTRVMQVLTGLPNGLVNETDDKRRTQYRGVEVQRVDGLSKTETRSLIEYYAKSGLLRDVVDDTMVSNMWTLSGSGNLGEVEKAVLMVKRGDDRMEGVKFRKAGGRK